MRFSTQVQSSPEAPPNFLYSGYRGPSRWVRHRGRRVDYSPPSKAEVKKVLNGTLYPRLFLHAMLCIELRVYFILYPDEERLFKRFF